MSEIDNEFTSQKLISELNEVEDLLNSECKVIQNTDLNANSDYCSNAKCLNSNEKQHGEYSQGFDNKAYSLSVLAELLQNNLESSVINQALNEPISENPSNLNKSTGGHDASNLNQNISIDENFEEEVSELVASDVSNKHNDVLSVEEKVTKAEDEFQSGKQSVDETSDKRKALPLTESCEVEKIIVIKIADDEHASGKQRVDVSSNEVKEFQLSGSCDIEIKGEGIAEDEHKSEKHNFNETSDEIKALQLSDSSEIGKIIDILPKDEYKSRKQRVEEKSDEANALQLRQNCEIEKISAAVAEEEYADEKQSVNIKSNEVKALQLLENFEVKKTLETIFEDVYESIKNGVDETSNEMEALQLTDSFKILSMSPRRDNIANKGTEREEVFNLRIDSKAKCPESCNGYSFEDREGNVDLQALQTQLLRDDLNKNDLDISDQLEDASIISEEKYVDEKLEKHDNRLNPNNLSDDKFEVTSQSVNHSYHNALKYFQNLCDLSSPMQCDGYFQIRKQRNKCAELFTDIQNVKKQLADVKSDISELKTRCVQIKNALRDMANK